MNKPATLASCIAKMYEVGRVDNSGTMAPSPVVKKPAGSLLSTLNGVEVKLSALETRVEQIAGGQAKVISRLDSVCRSVAYLERHMARLGQGTDAPVGGEMEMLEEVRTLCVDMVALLQHLQQEDRWHREKMEAVDKALMFVVDIFRSSRIAEFTLQSSDPGSGGSLLPNKDKKKDKSDDKPVKPRVAFQDQETQVDADDGRASAGISQASAPRPAARGKVCPPDPPAPEKHTLPEIQASRPTIPGQQGGDAWARAPRRPKGVTLKSREPTRKQTFAKGSQDGGDKGQGLEEEAKPKEVSPSVCNCGEQVQELTGHGSRPPGLPLISDSQSPPLGPRQEQHEAWQTVVPCSTHPDTGATLNSKESFTVVTPPPSGDGARASGRLEPNQKVEPIQSSAGAELGLLGPTVAGPAKTDAPEEKPEALRGRAPVFSQQSLASEPIETPPELLVIDDCPPKPAPFDHRIVSAKQVLIGSYYIVRTNEVLGGGRFGQVHRCTELSSGLTLAAKIIKVKGMKDRDEVKNEIGVMNQLNHVNLIQLYDAFETRTNLTLIMEYVEGGELFDRIVDENYQLTELDAIVFTRQICEGVQYLHQQYILHLDLKPENILCVSTTGNQIKIIDFGLARKYRPREKLKVNFGTPEFLAPEVVNYDFVSFPTDMWSVGVITYMLLSGLSPFLGDSDTETMNNILQSNWDFDAEAFENVSQEAKDFVSRLLIPEKCSRLSASGCVKHSWLNNLEEKAKKHRVRLKSQLRLQRYLAAHRQWKKHFHVVAATNRLRRLCSAPSTEPA
ncbi:myosin light chain kinase 3 isoform X2 [Scleropages formosus]|uniref:myosin light chain kinase 3 isoform X2 n=1 Tax=Scleropages formosus TaxID=113540 RepID=UPI000F33A051|nr:myosin light chain kinase 3 isoform X2 [Scleropages formosus]